MWIEVAIAIAAISLAAGAQSEAPEPAKTSPRVEWRESAALGTPSEGALHRGVRLPAAGRAFFTWDPILRRRPNRDWRRWGADRTVRETLRIARAFAREHPAARPIGIGDLSLREGGYFGPEVSGGIGHATHQNGLDVDVYYPRRDGRLRPPDRPEQVDIPLAQDLVDRFVAAGATTVYVGPSLALFGPPDIVVPLVNHDNHLHARFAEP